MLSFLAETAHRPYPLPAGPWVMRQTWEHLLFAHWPVPAETLRALVPPQLDLDTHAGRAWLGVVPFGMRGVYPRHTWPVPGLSTLLELNVGPYVTAGGRWWVDGVTEAAAAGGRESPAGRARANGGAGCVSG